MSVQLAWKTAIWSSRRSMSGMLAEGRSGVGLLVLGADGEHDAARAERQRHLLDGEKGLAVRRALAQRDAVARPSSPITPPQSVLSRSSTRHLRDCPRTAAMVRATISA